MTNWNALSLTVMPALVAGIHVLRPCNSKDVDGRDKPGHDEGFGPAMTNWNTAFSTVMPGFMPGIHVLTTLQQQRRGWPGQARP